jgi:hypothetical protein
MPVWKLLNMTMLQCVKKQLNMRNALTSANFKCIKVDFKDDSDEEVKENKYRTALVNVYKARADM